MSGTLRDLAPGQKHFVRQRDITNYDGGGVARAKPGTSLLQGGKAADAVEVHVTDLGHVEFSRGSGPRACWVRLAVE